MKPCIWQITRARTATILCSAFFPALLVLQLKPVGAATLIVSNLNDSGSGSLRDTIAASVSGDTIVFANGLAGTIALTNGGFAIDHDLTLTGPGANVLTNSGGSPTFFVGSGTFNISGLTVVGGSGAIYNANATCRINNCAFTGQNTTASTGFVPVLNNQSSGVMVVNGSSVYGNITHGGGGNPLVESAAIVNSATMAMTNCTVSENALLGSSFGEDGLAILNYMGGVLTISCCTIVSNRPFQAVFGAGICNLGGGVLVANSIIAGNGPSGTTAPDCSGPFGSRGYNLIGITNGSSGWGSVGDNLGSSTIPLNPVVGPLQNNGGTTPTHALLAGSPAIDSGNSFGATTDQRGKPRPFDLSYIPNAPGGDGSDIGAYELNPPLLNIARSSTNVILYWPIVDGSMWLLQSNSSLTATGGWSTVTGTPATNGNSLVVTNGLLGDGTFYRLKL